MGFMQLASVQRKTFRTWVSLMSLKTHITFRLLIEGWYGLVARREIGRQYSLTCEEYGLLLYGCKNLYETEPSPEKHLSELSFLG